MTAADHRSGPSAADGAPLPPRLDTKNIVPIYPGATFSHIPILLRLALVSAALGRVPLLAYIDNICQQNVL